MTRKEKSGLAALNRYRALDRKARAAEAYSKLYEYTHRIAIDIGLGCEQRQQERERAEQKRRKGYYASAAHRIAARRWQKKNTAKDKAHRALKYALKTGMRRAKRCSQCGAKGRIEAHHHRGYATRHHLDVIWLCPTCHRHTQKRKEN